MLERKIEEITALARPGLLVQYDDGVLEMIIDRPERFNALTFEIYEGLVDVFRMLERDSSVSVVVITGAGRAFCAGGDVEEIIGALGTFDKRQVLAFTRLTGQVVEAMRSCVVPIICSVNGTAAGAGAVIALAADLRLVSDKASFHFLFSRVGLAGGDMGSAYLLPRVVGQGRAAEILYFGDAVPAQEALRIGLANRVVPSGELRNVTAEWARRLATGPTFASQSTKRLLLLEADMDLKSSLELEAVMQSVLIGADDHGEFIQSMKEKRDPVWTGR